ncbi:MAG: hypothetical protein AAFY00_08130 [Bacteroidota bacterium]
MKFTVKLTAENVSLKYGIVKQVVFDVPDATAAYKKHGEILGDYLGNRKSNNGFTGCFIGHCLELWDGVEFEFELTREDFRPSDGLHKLEVTRWRDRNGKLQTGDPRV